MVLQRTAKHEVGLEAIQDRNVSQKRGGRQIHKTNVQKNAIFWKSYWERVSAKDYKLIDFLGKTNGFAKQAQKSKKQEGGARRECVQAGGVSLEKN